MKPLKTQETGEIDTLFADGLHVSLQAAIEAFIRIERANWSDQTCTWYADRLGDLAETIGAGKPLSDLLEADVRGWYVLLSERRSRWGISRPAIEGGLSAFTLHGYIRAAKRFFRWLCKTNILSADLGDCLKLPRLPRNARKGISDANAAVILEAARSDPRDYALITFIESSGVRRGGAEDLKLSDLNLESDNPKLRLRAQVREKGEKERTVIFSDICRQALVEWLSVRPEIGDEHVFLGSSPGAPWHALKPTGISEIFRRYKNQLGLKGSCSPHQWRHRFCRKLLENGMPLVHVSDLAGHADIKVTRDFYGGFDIDSLQSSYEKHYKPPD